jgi:O-antigen/teichoic acid export membrane protein
MPFITRLYSPAELGGLGVIIAIGGILAVVATGRYDMGILLPRKDRHAANLAWISVALSSVTALISLGLMFFAGSQLALSLDAPTIRPFLYIVPLLIFLGGSYQALNQWVIRKGQYKRVAINRVSETSLGAATNLFMGLAGAGLGGLVTGTIVGRVAATGGMFRAAKKSGILRFRPRWREVRYLIARYSNLPRVSVPASLINAIAQHSPIILVGILFGPVSTGMYALTTKVLNKPTALISNSVSSVFKREAAKAYNLTGNCRSIYVKTFVVLLAISFLPFVTIIIAAPPLFAWIFGEGWSEAGTYAQILAILVWLKFIGMPLCYMFYLAERLRADLMYQVGFMTITLGSFIAGFEYFGEIGSTLMLFVVSYSLLYLVRIVHSYFLTVCSEIE